MAKYQIKTGSASVFPWEIAPEWIEDGFYGRLQYLVGAEVEAADGSVVRLFHVNDFVNNPEGAQRLADRVNARGEIDSEWWGVHGFLSRSLEERLAEEAVVDQYERDGYLEEYNGWMSNYVSVTGA
jgi:hypothetical protein